MQSIETACDYTSFEIYSSSHSVLNSERELKKLCTNPETGSDLRSLLAVSRLLHQTRLKKQEKACDQMIIYNYRLDSAAEELSKSKPLIIRQGDTIDVTSVKEVLAASVSRQATTQQEKAPGHWFHVNTYCDSDLQARGQNFTRAQSYGRRVSDVPPYRRCGQLHRAAAEHIR